MGRKVITDENIPAFVEERKLTEEEEKAIKADEDFYHDAEAKKRIVRADFFDTPERMIDRILQGVKLYHNVTGLNATEARNADGKLVGIPPGVEMISLGLLKQIERFEAIEALFDARGAKEIAGICRDIVRMLGRIRVDLVENANLDTSVVESHMTILRARIVEFWAQEDKELRRE